MSLSSVPEKRALGKPWDYVNRITLDETQTFMSLRGVSCSLSLALACWDRLWPQLSQGISPASVLLSVTSKMPSVHSQVITRLPQYVVAVHAPDFIVQDTIETRSRDSIEVDLRARWEFVTSARTRVSICNEISVETRGKKRKRDGNNRVLLKIIGPDCTVDYRQFLVTWPPYDRMRKPEWMAELECPPPSMWEFVEHRNES